MDDMIEIYIIMSDIEGVNRDRVFCYFFWHENRGPLRDIRRGQAQCKQVVTVPVEWRRPVVLPAKGWGRCKKLIWFAKEPGKVFGIELL